MTMRCRHMINEKAFSGSQFKKRNKINFETNVAGLPSHNYMRRGLVIVS